ncbi:hypothetical protein B0H16DRAFT_1455691 [Mycena metata]|uniref:Uncharacterized protein n=1 Tax=Mycena metata TaxID=1033252 RepID=A0AAD7JED9_9AGAR|nr:hypothetical protein B0H16DRAFT_1455691 [Mycena metata]
MRDKAKHVEYMMTQQRWGALGGTEDTASGAIYKEEILTPTITLLKELNDAFGPPFIQSIVTTVQALIAGVQKVKRNKDDCFQLVESLHQVLYLIIHLHLKSETAGSLLPSVLDKIAEFTK